LREHEAAFRAKGANLAAIGMGSMDYARTFRQDTGIGFPLLVDEQRQAYAALELKRANLLHLFRRDNAAARKRAKASGFRQHALGENPFQLGGSFVFAPGGELRYSHLSRTFGDNAPIADLLAALP
jgi:peroxiredoxin